MNKTTRSDGLLRHSLVLMAASQVANICNLAFHSVMGRRLDDYSLLSTMLNIMLIINTPLDAMRTATAHFVSRAMQDDDRGAVREMLRGWGLRLLAVSSAFCVAGLLFSGPLTSFFSAPSRMYIVITSATVMGIVYVPFLTGILQGLQAFNWMAFAIQGLSVTRLAVGALLVWTILPTAMSGLYAQVFGVALALAIGYVGIRRRISGAGPARLAVQGIRGYLWQSFCLLAAYSVLMMADMLIVRHYLPVQTAEQFARAATIARSIIFLPMPIAFAMFPKVVSTGSISGESRRMLMKAVGMVVGLIGLGMIGCLAVPQLPLMVMYGRASATPEAMHLVKLAMCAMAPLALTYLLMNFEMAQHRFRATGWLILCAVCYIGGVALWHQSAQQIVLVLGAVSLASSISFIATMPWRATPGA